MNGSTKKFLFLFTLIALGLFTPSVAVQDADAGVLLRSGAVRSRVRARTPRMRLGYKPASTWVSVSRRVNPINSKTLTSTDALNSYSRRRERYMRELERYERRQERNAKRREARQARERKRELRAQKRQMEKIIAKRNRKAALERELGGDSVELSSKSSDSGVVTIENRGEKSQPSFWRRFWQKLIGRR